MTIQEAINGFEMDNALLAGSGETGVIERNTLAIDALRKAAADNWIPVSERLPEDFEEVNITWVNRNPPPYYKDIKDEPFTATGVHFHGKWYWWDASIVDELKEYGDLIMCLPIDAGIEITAWQPLPESYRGGEQ